MKRLGFFLLLAFLAVQISYKIAPLLAQEGDDSLAIQNVIKTFYESSARSDLNSEVNQISPNFSAVVNGETLDYNKNIIFMKTMNERRDGETLDYSNYNYKTTKLNINGNSAVAEVDFDWQGVNRKTNQDVFGHLKRSLSLAKENGTWKITSIEVLTVKAQ